MTHRRKVKARNYAADSENRIHSDEVAARYGFAGGLVPGIALYAYFADSITELFGDGWLEDGSSNAKFISPVYDQDEVEVAATEATEGVNLELRDSKGTLCAVGKARRSHSLSWREQEPKDLPAAIDKLDASIGSIVPGTLLGSFEFTFGNAAAREFAERAGAVGTSGFMLAQANEIVVHNVALGPWIHTASIVNNFGIPREGEVISVRGSVVDAVEKRGHEVITCDLSFSGIDGRPVALVRHSAIIRLREHG